jgi:hypothetical protein
MDDLVDWKRQALEGEFAVKMCGAGIDTCTFIPDALRPAVAELVSSHAGRQ